MRFRFSSLGVAIALTACNASSGGAEAGMETGPCIDGGCFEGLNCLSDLCVGDETTPTGSSTSTQESNPPVTVTVTVTVTSGSTATSDASAGPGSSTNTPDDDDTAGPSTSGTGSSTGGPDVACTVWDQNCPRGQKCNPWADDGGDVYNAARCVDLDASPAGIEGACTVEGAVTSGEDDCELGAMCWGVNAGTGLGTCVELCSGTAASPDCSGGNRCSIYADGATPVCLEECDPIAQNCPGADACYSFAGVVECAPDMSGAAGAYRDACAGSGTCDPGLSCTLAGKFVDCPGLACCTPFCELGTNDCPAGTACAALLGPEDALIFAAIGWCVVE